MSKGKKKGAVACICSSLGQTPNGRIPIPPRPLKPGRQTRTSCGAASRRCLSACRLDAPRRLSSHSKPSSLCRPLSYPIVTPLPLIGSRSLTNTPAPPSFRRAGRRKARCTYCFDEVCLRRGTIRAQHDDARSRICRGFAAENMDQVANDVAVTRTCMRARESGESCFFAPCSSVCLTRSATRYRWLARTTSQTTISIHSPHPSLLLQPCPSIVHALLLVPLPTPYLHAPFRQLTGIVCRNPFTHHCPPTRAPARTDKKSPIRLHLQAIWVGIDVRQERALTRAFAFAPRHRAASRRPHIRVVIVVLVVYWCPTLTSSGVCKPKPRSLTTPQTNNKSPTCTNASGIPNHHYRVRKTLPTLRPRNLAVTTALHPKSQTRTYPSPNPNPTPPPGPPAENTLPNPSGGELPAQR